MFGILGYFKAEDEYDFFSPVIGIAAILAILDILIRKGLLSIGIPRGIIHIEISVAIEIALKTAPTIVMLLHFATLSFVILKYESEHKSEEKFSILSNIIYINLSGYVCFVYFLYCFFSNFESVFIEPSLKGTIFGNRILLILLKITPYVRTISYLIEAFAIKVYRLYKKVHLLGSEVSDGRETYNTYTYEFENGLTEKQIQTIKALVQKPLGDNDSDSGFSKKEQLLLKCFVYKEIFKDRLILGLYTDDDEYDSFRTFEEYIRIVNEELLKTGCKYLMTVNNEKYDKIRVFKKDHREQEEIQIIRVGK